MGGKVFTYIFFSSLSPNEIVVCWTACLLNVRNLCACDLKLKSWGRYLTWIYIFISMTSMEIHWSSLNSKPKTKSITLCFTSVSYKHKWMNALVFTVHTQIYGCKECWFFCSTKKMLNTFTRHTIIMTVSVSKSSFVLSSKWFQWIFMIITFIEIKLEIDVRLGIVAKFIFIWCFFLIEYVKTSPKKSFG